MLWLKSFHLIFIVTWFSGIFYLPRLYVYHSMSNDTLSIERFKIMERKLLFWITNPSGVLATGFGFALLLMNWDFYLHQTWMQIKLLLVGVLWIYHFLCIQYYQDFKKDRNQRGHRFFRWFNEVPSVILIAVIILAVVKPFN